MFKQTEAFSSFAVPDIDAAKDFYGETLGLDVKAEEMGFLTINLAGGRPTMIYPKPDHVPANYTVLNFRVEDLDAAVDQLRERGVEMQRYDAFDQDEKGISREEGPRIAWFADPAGNVLAVIQAD